jgi:hypothetical protein
LNSNRVPNSNSNSGINWKILNTPPAPYNMRIPVGSHQYGIAQTGKALMRGLNQAHMSGSNRLSKQLTNSVLAQIERLRNAKVRGGKMGANAATAYATSQALARIEALLGPNIRSAERNALVKRMRNSIVEKMKARTASMAASARATRNRAFAGARATRNRAASQKAAVRAAAAAAVSAATAARNRTLLGGKAAWKGATTAGEAVSRRARSAALGIDSGFAAPINMRLVRPVRDMVLERRVQKILAEFARLRRMREVLAPTAVIGTRNADRVKKINATLVSLQAKKTAIEAAWNAQNKKKAGWSWLKKFGRRS